MSLTPPAALAQEETVSASDYMPVDPNQFCKKIYSYTFGPAGSFTNQIVGSLTAPYVTQPLTGGLFCGLGNDVSLVAYYNDGRLFANILDGDHYPSVDCNMTSFPWACAMGQVRDGEILAFGDCPLIVRKHLSSCEVSGDADESLLFRIQNVKAGHRNFTRAVVVWFLQNDQPFVPLTFYGKDLQLGITLPDAEATGGRRVEAFFMLGRKEGAIAGGQIAGETGTLVALWELMSVDCSSGARWDIFDVPGNYNALARGINDNKDTVGNYGSPGKTPKSFLRRNGVLTLFHPAELSAISSWAADINNVGDIVGYFDDSQGRHGYLLRNGVYTRIDAPGGGPTQAHRINDRGDIAGSVYTTSAPSHGFLLRGGAFTRIDYPGATWTEVMGLSNSGDIVGSFLDAVGIHGFLLRGEVFTKIDYPDAVLTRLTAINDEGHIVGGYRMPGGAQLGFLRVGGEFQSFSVPCAGDPAIALDVNAKDDVAGNFLDESGRMRWAFVVSDLKKDKLK